MRKIDLSLFESMRLFCVHSEQQQRPQRRQWCFRLKIPNSILHSMQCSESYQRTVLQSKWSGSSGETTDSPRVLKFAHPLPSPGPKLFAATVKKNESEVCRLRIERADDLFIPLRLLADCASTGQIDEKVQVENYLA